MPGHQQLRQHPPPHNKNLNQKAKNQKVKMIVRRKHLRRLSRRNRSLKKKQKAMKVTKVMTKVIAVMKKVISHYLRRESQHQPRPILRKNKTHLSKTNSRTRATRISKEEKEDRIKDFKESLEETSKIEANLTRTEEERKEVGSDYY